MWKQNPRLITGQNGPYSIPNCQQNYQNNPQLLAGSRGWNAFYNWAQQKKNDPTDQLSQTTFQYTNPNQPSFFDAFGVGNAAIKFLGNGKNTLDLTGVSQLTDSNMTQAANYLGVLDQNGDRQLDAKEIGALTLLEDKPTNVLWDIIQASKNSPSLSEADKAGIMQLEKDLKSVLTFDPQGNAIREPADGQITPQERALLDHAVRLAPGVVKEAIKQLSQALDLNKTYQEYLVALQKNQASLQSPWANQYQYPRSLNDLPGHNNGLPFPGPWLYPNRGNSVLPPMNFPVPGGGIPPWQSQGFDLGMMNGNMDNSPNYSPLDSLFSLLNTPPQGRGLGNPHQNTRLYILMLLLMQMQNTPTSPSGNIPTTGYAWPNPDPNQNPIGFNRYSALSYGDWPATPSSSSWYNTPLSMNG